MLSRRVPGLIQACFPCMRTHHNSSPAVRGSCDRLHLLVACEDCSLEEKRASSNACMPAGMPSINACTHMHGSASTMSCTVNFDLCMATITITPCRDPPLPTHESRDGWHENMLTRRELFSPQRAGARAKNTRCVRTKENRYVR